MPVIHRPAKALGNADYADEVAQGKPDIIDIELDNDIKPLYALQDHAIDTSNLAAHAEITYDQLHHPIGIQQSDFAPGVVVPPNSVNGGTSIQIHTITADRLVPGATTISQQIRGDDSEALLTTGPETLIGEIAWTTKGGYWIANGIFLGRFQASNIAGDVTATFRLRVDSSASGVLDGAATFLGGGQTGTLHFIYPDNGTVPLMVPLITQGNFLLSPARDPHLIQLTGQCSTGQLIRTSWRLLLHETT